MKARWFIRGGGKLYGPLDDARLRVLVFEGKIDQSTELALDPRGPWHPAGRVRGLFANPGYSERATPNDAASVETGIGETPNVKSGERDVNEDRLIAEMLAEQRDEGQRSLAITEQLGREHQSLATFQQGAVQRPAARPSVPMTRCPACGTSCAHNARHCPQCGYRFPSSAPFVVGGLILVVLVIGLVVATLAQKKREEAEIWREVHRQNRERQEKTQRELEEAWGRLRRSLR